MTSLSNLLLNGLIASQLWAGSVIVYDPFNVPGNSDVVGNKLQFDAQSIQVTARPGALTLDIRTNFDNAALHSHRDTGVRLDVGDVFFTVNGNYAFGVPLAYHNGPSGGPWGDRLYAGHIYAIDDPDAVLNARQTLHDPMYLDYRPDQVVWMVDLGGVHDVTTGTPTVEIIPITGNNGVNGPLYDIRVTTSLPAGLFSSPSDSYGVLFSVGTGGNDIVEGALDFGADAQSGFAGADAAVPEPGTWYMMIGVVLVGVARLVSRRR
jgi:hypothetical protein